MSSKNFFLILFICFVVGCSDFIKGQKKEEEVLRLNKDRFACLNQMPEVLRNITTDKSNPDKLEQTFVCLENSLAYFKKRTKGNVPDGYSVQDIRSFFGNYLGDRDRVSDEMANEMMKVKKALFGGTEQVIAKSELQAFIDLLAIARVEVGNLKPFWDVILLKKGLKPDMGLMLRGNQALKDALISIVLKTHLVKSDYTFADFKTLMGEIEKFVHRPSDKDGIEFMQWMPLIESVKIHLFSDRADMNTSFKWKEAVSMVMELHHLYSLYEYHYKGYDFYTHQAFRAGDEMLVSMIGLLGRSWWMQRDGIPFVETEKLLQALADQKLLPDDMTVPTVYEVYQTLVRNFLDRETGHNKAVAVKALSKKHIEALKREYRGFKAVQNFNDSMPDQFTYQDLIKHLDKSSSFEVSAFAEVDDESFDLSWRDWNVHLRQAHPLLYLKTGELLLDRHAKDSSEWSWAGLARLNVMKFLNRVLMIGFGTQHTLDLSHEVLNEESMKGFYSDFWNFGVHSKAFDPRSGNSGKRTYFEADHFVYAGDGDGNVGLQESFELVNIIFSAGLSGLDRIQKDLYQSNCALPEKDFFGNPWLDEACFKKLLHQNFGIYFKNLTGLKSWVEGLDESGWNTFYDELIDFSRVSTKAAGRVETGDLRTLVVITHYIESMYIKMDSDEDDRLSIGELIDGSQRFIPFFKTLFKLEPRGPFLKKFQEHLIDFAVSRAFACMVITGEMPKVQTCTPEFFDDIFFTKPYSDRTLILRTLNAFKSSIK